MRPRDIWGRYIKTSFKNSDIFGGKTPPSRNPRERYIDNKKEGNSTQKILGQ